MKLTLMIEGSPAVIAPVLAALPGGAMIVTDQQELPLAPTPVAQTAVTATEPVTSIPMPNSEPVDADDNAPADPGAPLFDSAGVPWDARIHAATKATVADGTWRMKRGVDKAVVDAVMPELRTQMIDMPGVGIMVSPVEPAPMPVEPAPMPVAQPMPVEPAPMPVAQPMPVVSAGVIPNPAVTGVSITIPEFMQKLSVQMTGPDAAITNEYLAEAVGKFNAAHGTTFVTVNDFFTAPDKLPALVQMITLDGKW